MEVKSCPAPITAIKEKEMRKDPEAEWRLKVQEQGDISARTVRSLWDAGEGKRLVKDQTLYSQLPLSSFDREGAGVRGGEPQLLLMCLIDGWTHSFVQSIFNFLYTRH